LYDAIKKRTDFLLDIYYRLLENEKMGGDYSVGMFIDTQIKELFLVA